MEGEQFPITYTAITHKCKLCESIYCQSSCSVCGYSHCGLHMVTCTTKEFFVMGGEIDNLRKIKFKKVASFPVCHTCLSVVKCEEVGRGKYLITFSNK